MTNCVRDMSLTVTWNIQARGKGYTGSPVYTRWGYSVYQKKRQGIQCIHALAETRDTDSPLQRLVPCRDLGYRYSLHWIPCVYEKKRQGIECIHEEETRQGIECIHSTIIPCLLLRMRWVRGIFRWLIESVLFLDDSLRCCWLGPKIFPCFFLRMHWVRGIFRWLIEFVRCRDFDLKYVSSSVF